MQHGKKRVKTGCLTCREKHKKCDEAKPSCGLCVKRKIQCRWPPPKDKITSNSFRIVKIDNDEARKYGTKLLESLDYKENEWGLPKEKRSVMGAPLGSIGSTGSIGSPLGSMGISMGMSMGSMGPMGMSVGSMGMSMGSMGMPSSMTPGIMNSLHGALHGPNSNGVEAGLGLMHHHRDLLGISPLGSNGSSGSSGSNGSPHDRLDGARTNAHLLNLINHPDNPLERILNNAEKVVVQKLPPPPPPLDEPKNDDEEIAPNALMAPFLTYSHLHRTFRDYIFVSASPAYNDRDAVTGLKNELPTFVNLGSNKMFQAYLKAAHDLVSDENDSQMNTKDEIINENDGVLVSYALRGRLYSQYLHHLAPWLDMTEGSTQFAWALPLLSKDNGTLLSAIYALGSRNCEQLDPNYNSKITIQLYEECVNSLIPYISKPLEVANLAACVFLCVFALLLSPPKKWRSQVRGCLTILKVHNITGFSKEPERNLFWCLVRMDICCSSILELPTSVEPVAWLPDKCKVNDLKNLFTKFGDRVNMHCNYIVFLVGRVMCLIMKPNEDDMGLCDKNGDDDKDKDVDDDDDDDDDPKLTYEQEWDSVWEELTLWFGQQPDEYHPVVSGNDTPFPVIVFLNGPPIMAVQLYHMAVILMIQNKPRHVKITHNDHVKSPIWHAKQIIGISLNNNHQGCWNYALEPLWIAGQLLSSAEEHAIILNLLEKIERCTGWPMSYRIVSLKQHWAEAE